MGSRVTSVYPMTMTIALSGKHGEGKFAIVDDEDYARVSQYDWYFAKDGYVFRLEYIRLEDGRYRQHRVWLHRFVLVAPLSVLVDHKNRDKLDNTRLNLREANRSQNAANSPPRAGTSAYKGVSWVKSRSVWKASIGVNGHYSTLGQFDNEIDAALAYDQAALRVWGEFARVNFPDRL